MIVVIVVIVVIIVIVVIVVIVVVLVVAGTPHRHYPSCCKHGQRGACRGGEGGGWGW